MPKKKKSSKRKRGQGSGGSVQETPPMEPPKPTGLLVAGVCIAAGGVVVGVCTGALFDRHIVPDWLVLGALPFGVATFVFGVARHPEFSVIVPRWLRGARIAALSFMVAAIFSIVLWERRPIPISLDGQVSAFHAFPGVVFSVSDDRRRIVPISVMAQLSLTNEDDVDVRVRRYSAEAKTGLVPWWHKLKNVSVTKTEQIAFCKTSWECAWWDPESFQRKIDGKIIKPGETVTGWVYYEFPPQLRDERVSKSWSLRMTFSTSDKESYTVPFSVSDYDEWAAEFKEKNARTMMHGQFGLCGAQIISSVDGKVIGIVDCSKQ